MSQTRKKIVVTIEEKLKALQHLSNGESLRAIAAKYGVGMSTVWDWKKNRDKMERWRKSFDSASVRKTMKKSEFHDLDEALYSWFVQQRGRGVQLTGLMLQQKAKSIRKEMLAGAMGDCFTASNTWLLRWKQRHNVHLLSDSNKKLSVDTNLEERLQRIIEDGSYTPDQIYSCSKTELNYNQHSNEVRVTAFLCSNRSSTHKLPLMIIGQLTEPQTLDYVLSNIPTIYYKQQRDHKVRSGLLKKWFFDQFVPKVDEFLARSGLARKALLLLSCANANELKSGDVTVMSISAKSVSFHLLDQRVEDFKHNYYRHLLETEIKEVDGKCSEEIILLNMLNCAATAWNDTECNSTVTKPYEEYENDTFREIGEWVTVGIKEEVTKEEFVNVKTENALEVAAKMSHSEGLAALEVALNYVKQQPNAGSHDVLLIQKWRDIAFKNTL